MGRRACAGGAHAFRSGICGAAMNRRATKQDALSADMMPLPLKMSHGDEHAQHTRERLMAEIRALKSANDALQYARGPFSMYGSTSALPDGQTFATLYTLGLVAVTSVGADGRRVLNMGNMDGMRQIKAQKMASVGVEFSKDDLTTRVKKERRGALFVETHFEHKIEDFVRGGTIVPARHVLGDHLRDFPQKHREFLMRTAQMNASRGRATGSSAKVLGPTPHAPWMCSSDGTPLEGVPVMPLCEEFSDLKDVVLLVNPSGAAPVQSSMVCTSAPCPARAPACSQLIASLSAIGFRKMDLADLKVPSRPGESNALVSIIEKLHEGPKKGPFMALYLANDQLDAFRATMFSFCFPSATTMRARPFPPELPEPVPCDQDYACIMTQCIGRTAIASQFGVPCVADMNLQCSSAAVSISASSLLPPPLCCACRS